MLGSVGIKIVLFVSGRLQKLQGHHTKTGSVGLAEIRVFVFRPKYHSQNVLKVT